jgi:hypothetical protein
VARVDDPPSLVTELVLIHDGLVAAYSRGTTDPTRAARDLARAAVSRHHSAAA